MSLFDSFSPRARRAIFWANSQAHEEEAPEITAEHILHGLLKEDPQLFVLLMPGNPTSIGDIQQKLATIKTATAAKSQKETLRLSELSKEIIRVAARERDKFGHSSVGTQHLLLAVLICPEKGKKFFRKTKQQKESMAKQVLAKSGLSVDSMEAATKAGLITPQTLVLNDAIFKLNAQLTAIADLLISKGFLTRNEFVSLLDENPGPITREAFLLPLINALCEKGQITKSEKDILGTEPRPYTAIEKDKT